MDNLGERVLCKKTMLKDVCQNIKDWNEFVCDKNVSIFYSPSRVVFHTKEAEYPKSIYFIIYDKSLPTFQGNDGIHSFTDVMLDYYDHKVSFDGYYVECFNEYLKRNYRDTK